MKIKATVAGFVVLLTLSGCVTTSDHHAMGICARDQCSLEQLVGEVITADYRGNVEYLSLLATHLDTLKTTDERQTAAQYWKAFAKWRQVLNNLNDGAAPIDVEATLSESISGFENILAREPDNVDARVGFIGGLQASMYLWPAPNPVFLQSLKRAAPVLASLRRDAPHNLRAAWVIAPALYRTPDKNGGGKAIAIEYARSVLANSDPQTTIDVLTPVWGRPELLATLAWMISDSNGRNPESEQLVLQALAIRPDWRYARDSLLPSVRPR